MLDLRAQYVARFAALPTVKRCEAHDGEFDADEVARLGAAYTPAIYVACMSSIELLDQSGPTAATLGWVAMVIARSEDAAREGQQTAGDVAALIALRIVTELNEGAPFDAALERPEKVRAKNLFGGELARAGCRIWGVYWQQATEIRPDELDAVLSDFRLLHTDADVAPHADPLESDLPSDTVLR